MGSYFLDRDEPPLGPEDQRVIDRFHDLYYRRWRADAGTISASWFGHPIWKCPLDLWIYQELLVQTRPDTVIETGTDCGGSALFLAMILEQIGHGAVVSIDVEEVAGRPVHPRLTYLTGSSVDPGIVSKVTARVAGGRALVILDSDHRAAHVPAELHAYGPIVQLGDYLIVEDTNLNGHPTEPDFGPGPTEAIQQFLAQSDEFAIDARCERFMLTLNPSGYLKRVNPGQL